MRQLIQNPKFNEIFITFTLNEHFEIIESNAKFIDTVGPFKACLQFEDLVFHKHLEDQEVMSRFKDTLSNGLTWEGDLAIRSMGNQLVWLHVIAVPEDDLIICVCTNITSRKQKLIEFEKHKRSLMFTSQLAAIGEMSTNIAHEIANPLTVIDGFTKKLISDVEQDKISQTDILKKLERISVSTKRIDGITKGMLKLARKTKEKEYELMDIKEVIEDTLDYCKSNLKSYFIDFQVRLPEIPLYIRCNEVKLSQALLNLINNARDVLIDQERKEIRLNIFTQEKSVFIQVIDSGPGVPAEHRENIFESFYTTKPVGKGTGLGLSMATNFVKENRGELTLTEVEGRTCFQIRLPLADNAVNELVFDAS